MPAEDPDIAPRLDGAELQACPQCGRQTLIAPRPDQPLAVCLSCGVVGSEDDRQEAAGQP
jgi:uncharacterized Zn finger protein